MRESIALFLVVLLCSSLWATNSPDDKHVERIRKEITKAFNCSCRIVVETDDQRRLQGLVSEVQPDNFVLTISGRSTTLAYVDVKAVFRPKHLMIAAGISATLYGLVRLIGGLRG
jgi:hypothetical protein